MSSPASGANSGRPCLALILGIRPDVIRASVLIRLLKASPAVELCFIWSGQHYSDNLKDVFFRELGVPAPDIELGAHGATDAEFVSDLIPKLSTVLAQLQPAAAIFLGDTNTVVSCIAAAQLNIPILHIEGCMRSYDWRMPEEKYRTVTDHLSDVIYAYFDEYKTQGGAEGINPANIVVVGNLIVDVLQRYYFDRRPHYETLSAQYLERHSLRQHGYYLMTCHRRENLATPGSLANILQLVGAAPYPVFFPAGYRTQAVLKQLALDVPANITVADPIGYDEMLCLITNSRGVITDSGTVVEETCVLQVPSLQMRRSTERPQVYDAGSSVKFDPARPEDYPAATVFRKLESLFGKKWPADALGDGKSSQRIVDDLHQRLLTGNFARHKREHYHVPTERSYREDGLD